MLCHSCGQQNADDCIFCVYCGAKVESSDEKTLKVETPSSSWKKESPPSAFSTANTEYPSSKPPPDIPPSDFTSDKESPKEPSTAPPYTDFTSEKENYKPPPPREESYKSTSGSGGFSSSSGSGYSEPAKTNVMAVASMIFSLLNILACCLTVPISIVPLTGYIIFPLHGIVALLSLILGIVGKKQISGSNGTQKGDGFALGGIIMGIIGIILFAIWLVLVVLGVATVVLMTILGEGSSTSY